MTCWQRRYRSLLVLALGLFLALSLVNLVLLRSAVSRFRSVTKRLVQERAAQKEEDKRLGKMAELQANHDTILQDIGSIEATPPRRLYQATLVAQLGQFAEHSAVTLLGVTPDNGGAPVEKGLPELPKDGPWRFVAVFSGHYNDVVKLVDSLQTFPKAVAVQSVNLRVDKALRDGTMRAEIVLLAREVAGVRDPATMTTIPVPPPSLMERFDHNTIRDWLKSQEQRPLAEAPGQPGPAAPMRPAPSQPGPSSITPGTRVPLGGSAQPGGAPQPGRLPFAPGAATTGGAAPTSPPGVPFGRRRSPGAGQPMPPPAGLPPGFAPGGPFGAPPAPSGHGGPPGPSTPDMLPGLGQSLLPDDMAPARSMANVGVVRRVFKIMRTDGLLPGGGKAVTDDGRVAANDMPARGKTR
ncbi:MAG: hypothetical protein HZB16_24215 [Armatimonadetes bacterium]|nr:hypothetical protein [Armatimonadota bacterium]